LQESRSQWRSKFRRSVHRVESCPSCPSERGRFIDERLTWKRPARFERTLRFKSECHIYGLVSPDELAAYQEDRCRPFRDQAVHALTEGDVGGFLFSMPEGNNYWLDVVRDNKGLLHSLGLYEAATVEAFMGCRVNNAVWSVGWLESLFSEMNPDRLAALRPIPAGESFRVYRGVAGPKGIRRVRGLSWTGSVECAAWFADRFASEGDPAVYVASVSRDDVWWHEPDCNEDEFVVRPRSPRRLRLDVEQLRELAQRHSDAIRKSNAATMGEADTKGR
jgi:hypothetical protein